MYPFSLQLTSWLFANIEALVNDRRTNRVCGLHILDELNNVVWSFATFDFCFLYYFLSLPLLGLTKSRILRVRTAAAQGIPLAGLWHPPSKALLFPINLRIMLPSSSLTMLESSSSLVVLVTAHPDDESMFFVPTLRYLTSQTHQHRRPEVWLICLTTGNHDGLGDVRVPELRRAAALLGVDKTIVLDDPRFPDDPSVNWDAENIVAKVLAQSLSDAIRRKREEENDVLFESLCFITFDQIGVSGHANHRDAYRAVRQLELAHQQQASDDDGGGRRRRREEDNELHRPLLLPARRVEVWTLETIRNPLKKYVPIWEWLRLVLCWFGLRPETESLIGCSLKWENGIATTTAILEYRLSHPTLNWKAMASHRSQFVWYRRLFVVFSCYTYVNRLRCVLPVVDDDLTAAAAKENDGAASSPRWQQEKLD